MNFPGYMTLFGCCEQRYLEMWIFECVYEFVKVTFNSINRIEVTLKHH
jgi:hypothetical protein